MIYIDITEIVTANSKGMLLKWMNDNVGTYSGREEFRAGFLIYRGNGWVINPKIGRDELDNLAITWLAGFEDSAMATLFTLKWLN